MSEHSIKEEGKRNGGLLTAAEVAQQLKLSRGTIWRWAKRGQLQHVRVGNEVRFDPNTLRDWLAGNTRRQGDDNAR